MAKQLLAELFADEILSKELLALKKQEIVEAFPEAVASKLPFVQACGLAPNGGAFLKITQFKDIVRDGVNRFQQAKTTVMVSVLMNVDQEMVNALELGHVFIGETLATIQTLDRSVGFPVASRNNQFGHIHGQPVYESHVLSAAGTKDSLLEGVEYVGENVSKRENAETIIVRGVARKGGNSFESSNVAVNPFAALAQN